MTLVSCEDPLAYSFAVLPLSIARWSQYNHKGVPSESVALFFGLTLFNLSGAIDVLLFLIIRPQLLLFAPPEHTARPEVQLSHLDTDPLVGMGPMGDLEEQFWMDSGNNSTLGLGGT